MEFFLESGDCASTSSSNSAEPVCTQLLNHRNSYHHVIKDEEKSAQARIPFKIIFNHSAPSLFSGNQRKGPTSTADLQKSSRQLLFHVMELAVDPKNIRMVIPIGPGCNGSTGDSHDRSTS